MSELVWMLWLIAGGVLLPFLPVLLTLAYLLGRRRGMQDRGAVVELVRKALAGYSGGEVIDVLPDLSDMDEDELDALLVQRGLHGVTTEPRPVKVATLERYARKRR